MCAGAAIAILCLAACQPSRIDAVCQHLEHGLYVNAQAKSFGTGHGWHSPLPTIRHAVAAARGDPSIRNIYVAGGTHTVKTETGTENTLEPVLLLQDIHGVTLWGGFKGNETCLQQRPPQPASTGGTILSGRIIGGAGEADEYTRHVVVVGDNVTSVTLDGFVIQDGRAVACPADVAMQRCEDGGGLLLQKIPQDLKIRNTVFAHNHAVGDGGGLLLRECSTCVLDNCRFQFNQAQRGAAVAILDTKPPGPQSPVFVVRESVFHNNQAARGAGVYAGGTDLLIKSSVFRNNHAQDGAGVGLYSGSRLGLTKSVFERNRAVGRGAAVFVDWTSNISDVNQGENRLRGNTQAGGSAVSIAKSPGDQQAE